MDFDIRPAIKADIPDLAKLLLMATDGIVASLYDGVIPGLATHEIVERRLAREDTCDSYVNCWVAADTDSCGARVAGNLHAYPLDDVAGDPPDPLVPEERGFTELSLAVFEENAAAVRLYERAGFAVAARSPVVPHPLIPPSPAICW